MKKSVVLLIACICLLSVMVVAFLGVSASNISPVVYITSVEILQMDGEDLPQGNSFRITFEPQILDENDNPAMQYMFSTRILPDNATSNSIMYSCPENPYVQFTNPAGGGLLVREKPYSASSSAFTVTTITCSPNDGGRGAQTDSVFLVIDYTQYYQNTVPGYVPPTSSSTTE